jgi:two-component system cell cycle sensor histidine kinase/response regulator CckA
VDEHASRRAAVSHALRRAGHYTLTAGTAEQAIELAESAPLLVDLLVTDLLLPGMDGAQLANRLRARTLGLRVIMIPRRDGAREAELAHGRDAVVLAEPFTPAGLASLVSASLKQGT